MAVINPEKLAQIALVVRDIEKSAAHYAHLFGVEPPKVFTTPPPEEAHTRFLGKPTPTQARLAVFHLGSVVLELIEPDDHPSSWRDFLDTHGEGVHHIGFAVDDLEATLEELKHEGIEERHSGDYPGGRYVFVDSSEQLGVFLNLKYDS